LWLTANALEVLRKTLKNLRVDDDQAGVWNGAFPEYMSREIPLRQPFQIDGNHFKIVAQLL